MNDERDDVDRRGALVAELLVLWRCILKLLPLDVVVEYVEVDARRDWSLARYCCCACCSESGGDGRGSVEGRAEDEQVRDLL